MAIVTVRRISQVFFFLLFVWFSFVSTAGEEWWELRGWPANWFLQLDPLVALVTFLATFTFYAGLLWALLTILLTLVLGRFFCGWVCPFGTLQHFMGYWSGRFETLGHLQQKNRYHPYQVIKYYLLVFLLSMALGVALQKIIQAGLWTALLLYGGIALCLLLLFRETWLGEKKSKAIASVFFLAGASGLLAAFLQGGHRILASSVQTGLLDPIPLMHRSLNLFLFPVLGEPFRRGVVEPRLYEGAWVIGLIFVAVLLLCLKIPRFYCRFICPLGALMGILGKWALYRVGKTRVNCRDCSVCEAHCEGACEPMGAIRQHECVLCMNCLDDCHHGVMGYGTSRSLGGERDAPDISRRGLVLTVAAGVVSIPSMRLSGLLASNRDPHLVRPPGALREEEFLQRCIKCGQCMRICPTNIIHPGDFSHGVESLWTPVLNFRVGTSGCQLNCVACGHICPTAAIRPISLEEKLGEGRFADAGPVRMGMAFVDLGRCLPWTMDLPCIVCQENCPVSPKAIVVHEVFRPIRDPVHRVHSVMENDFIVVTLERLALQPARLATGDYYVRWVGEEARWRIQRNTEREIELVPQARGHISTQEGKEIEILVRLHLPQVDPHRCIGCGVCEHECPVTGKRAIRVTAENESREKRHSMILHGS